MNPDKRKALEAAGWRVGDADDFLGEAMNIDEAIYLFCESNEDDFFGLSEIQDAGEILAAEVKRLRDFTEAQRRDNEQLRDRIKVLESQAKPPTAEESREAFEVYAKQQNINTKKSGGKYWWGEAKRTSLAWQAAVEWVAKRQQES